MNKYVFSFYFFSILFYLSVFERVDYAVYNTSWENTYALDYNNNWDEDQRKVLLMELNAWASVLYERTHHMNDAFIFLGNVL